MYRANDKESVWPNTAIPKCQALSGHGKLGLSELNTLEKTWTCLGPWQERTIGEFEKEMDREGSSTSHCEKGSVSWRYNRSPNPSVRWTQMGYVAMPSPFPSRHPTDCIFLDFPSRHTTTTLLKKVSAANIVLKKCTRKLLIPASLHYLCCIMTPLTGFSLLRMVRSFSWVLKPLPCSSTFF